jgi:uncharacterized OB-fold protein
MQIVNFVEVGGKVRSKHELYRMLTAKGHLYHPPSKICLVYFIADILEQYKQVG